MSVEDGSASRPSGVGGALSMYDTLASSCGDGSSSHGFTAGAGQPLSVVAIPKSPGPICGASGVRSSPGPGLVGGAVRSSSGLVGATGVFRQEVEE